MKPGSGGLAILAGELPRARRWPTPTGKDPSDYLQSGGDIRKWIKAALPKTDEVAPFPKQWPERFDIAVLERLAIKTLMVGLAIQKLWKKYASVEWQDSEIEKPRYESP